MAPRFIEKFCGVAMPWFGVGPPMVALLEGLEAEADLELSVAGEAFVSAFMKLAPPFWGVLAAGSPRLWAGVLLSIVSYEVYF